MLANKIIMLRYFTFVNYYALISLLLCEKLNWSIKKEIIGVISLLGEEEERKIL